VTKTRDRHSAPGTKGRVLHSAAGYDLLAWLFLLGRERAFRETLVRLARLEPGQSVLDIGCGTGSLAIAAKRRVGPLGRVHGIDASPEMIARARKKARKAGVDVTFTNGVVERLPLPDERFDAVLSTLMLHHLPRAAREQCVREIRRVLKPGGRVLAVDFGGATGDRKSLIEHFHRHGHVAMQEIVQLLGEAGLEIIESGPVGVRDLSFVLARA
jgi:ubiquinone/menaquinone biosynthesis C-methylase UbiE